MTATPARSSVSLPSVNRIVSLPVPASMNSTPDNPDADDVVPGASTMRSDPRAAVDDIEARLAAEHLERVVAAPPESWSLPPPPSITSAAGVPASTSSAAVPVGVAPAEASTVTLAIAAPSPLAASRSW